MTSKFVLIHSKEGVDEAKARLAAPQASVLSKTKRLSGQIGGALLDGLDAIRDSGATLSNFLRQSTMTASTTSFPPPTATIRKARRKSAPEAKPAVRLTVGIWSLDAWLGSISQLIEALNNKQSTFVFYEVEASVPAGLISRPERLIPWLDGALEKNPDDEATKRMVQEAKDRIKDNLIANDFFGLADLIRTDLGLDYIVGVTPSMVAGIDEDGYYTNHFSTYEDRTILASSYDLHEFAGSSGLSFEAFLTTIIVSELLVAVSTKLEYHPDTGCLFDYNADRVSLIKDVRDPMIEPHCMELIEPQYRDAAKSLVDFIRSIRSAKP